MSLLKVNQIQTVAGARYNFGRLVNFQHYNTGFGPNARLQTTSTAWQTLRIGGDSRTGSRLATDNDVLAFSKKEVGTHLAIEAAIPIYITPGGSGVGIRCRIGTTTSTGTYTLIDITDEGPAHGWGASGYGGNSADIITYTWYTRDKAEVNSLIQNVTGPVYLFFQVRNWVSSDTAYWIDYVNATYPKFGSINIYEYSED
jgi:hypothetical protein